MQWSELHARMLITVTVPAQEWMVKQIAGDHVDVLTMIPAGHVAETAQPGPQTLARSRAADLHFIVGHPSLLFERRYITAQWGNGPDFDQKHVRVSMYEAAKEVLPLGEVHKTDPHLWTSISIMTASAEMLTAKLIQHDPDYADTYRKNLVKLKQLMKDVDQQLRTALNFEAGHKILVYHPAWGNFARDYGVKQIAVEHEGKPPGAATLARIMAANKSNDIRYIISSPGSDLRRAQLIAEQLKIDVLEVDPMDSDWLKMIHGMETAVENNNDR